MVKTRSGNDVLVDEGQLTVELTSRAILRDGFDDRDERRMGVVFCGLLATGVVCFSVVASARSPRGMTSGCEGQVVILFFHLG